MRQAITTKYFGPSNVRGSRIKATAAAGSVWYEYEPAYGLDQNHTEAAAKLANKFGWKGAWFGGVLVSGDYVFVNTENITRDEAAILIT